MGPFNFKCSTEFSLTITSSLSEDKLETVPIKNASIKKIRIANAMSEPRQEARKDLKKFMLYILEATKVDNHKRLIKQIVTFVDLSSKLKKNTYFLLLGSNQDSPNHQLKRARIALTQEVGQILAVSGTYQTAAWGMTEQDDFLNQVIRIESEHTSFEMLARIQKIERELGRERKMKWGPRLIDIDILYADQEVIQTEQLIIPHPEIQNRRFTLIPLCEIAPDFVHPILGKSNRQLLEICKDLLPVNLYKLDTST